MLGGLYTLNLTGCDNITDVSMLDKINTLIGRVAKITNVCMLANV
jgi:hypothetical protein